MGWALMWGASFHLVKPSLSKGMLNFRKAYLFGIPGLIWADVCAGLGTSSWLCKMAAFVLYFGLPK